MPLDPQKTAEAIALLEAGDWRGAHEIVQRDEHSALACWAHGIVHLMEGDLPNARYWYAKAGRDFPKAPSVDDEIQALKKNRGQSPISLSSAFRK